MNKDTIQLILALLSAANRLLIEIGKVSTQTNTSDLKNQTENKEVLAVAEFKGFPELKLAGSTQE